MNEKYRPVLIGILFGLATLLYAEFMASTFGLYEEDIKGALLAEALEHTEGVAVPAGHEHEEDIAQKVFKDRKDAEKTASKAWVYLKRAHAHAEGLGVIAIVLSILLANTLLKPLMKKLFSLAVGLGTFLYPLSWFYAGTFMVDKGKVAAKADVHFLAVSSVSLYMGALIFLFILLTLHRAFGKLNISRFFFEEQG